MWSISALLVIAFPIFSQAAERPQAVVYSSGSLEPAIRAVLEKVTPCVVRIGFGKRSQFMSGWLQCTLLEETRLWDCHASAPAFGGQDGTTWHASFFPFVQWQANRCSRLIIGRLRQLLHRLVQLLQ